MVLLILMALLMVLFGVAVVNERIGAVVAQPPPLMAVFLPLALLVSLRKLAGPPVTLKSLHIPGILGSLLVAAAGCHTSALEDARRVSQADPDYQVIRQAALEWQQAVIDGNIDVLVSYTWPEMHDGARRLLADTTSDAHRRLLSGSDSIASLLKSVPPHRVHLFEQRPEFAPSTAFRYLVVCYDASAASRQWPTSFVALVGLHGTDVFCRYWMKDGPQMLTSYDFLLPDDGDGS